jgi:hypothetical protein
MCVYVREREWEENPVHVVLTPTHQPPSRIGHSGQTQANQGRLVQEIREGQAQEIREEQAHR